MREAEIQIADLIDSRPLNAFHAFILALCFLILCVDGMDFGAANVAAPAILRAFHAEKSAMGMVFGWGYFGILIGSVIFGYIGDRFGRRLGAIASVLAYSLPGVVTVFVSSFGPLSALRFLAGLGIGGVIPNTIALLVETAPRRFRASFVMFAFVGYSTGVATIGLVAARFIPRFGWSSVFLVAGVAGVALGMFLAFFLPESAHFLAVSDPQSPKLRKIVSRLAPDSGLSSNSHFFLLEKAKSKFSIRLLFTDNHWAATSLLWTGYFAEALTFMTLSSWLPFLLESAGLSPRQASLTYSYAALCAIACILLVSRLLDSLGPVTAVFTALCSIASIISLSYAGVSMVAIIITALLAYSFSSSTHNALNATVGYFYPTQIRGSGVGYATGMGRIAAIFGPTITGYLLSAKLPMKSMLYLIAAPYLVVILAFFGLSLIHNRQNRGENVGDYNNPVATSE